MLEEHAKIVQFIGAADGITGRKKLQKMVYIAKKLQFSFKEKYEFHVYGPYSVELTTRVEELCNMGFLNEERQDKGSYVQYKYQMTDEGEHFAQMAQLEDASPALVSCITQMKDKSSRFLELVSTLLYFDHLPKDEQIEKLHVVKGKLNFSEEEIEEAFSFVMNLMNERAVQ
ncbi:YwgA family protein [Bacillus sp. Cr_A10]|uniref:YwgA family protein n=1 Tax=Bacillaceae TaxID=186817 RepID=UPI0023DA9899|nr:YwgA family protein [Bacillus sp. Cr_A10]MDF2068054.1 YwgA family protein [Bacillus sp. Cr_A10]